MSKIATSKSAYRNCTLHGVGGRIIPSERISAYVHTAPSSEGGTVDRSDRTHYLWSGIGPNKCRPEGGFSCDGSSKDRCRKIISGRSHVCPDAEGYSM